jgi:hypothetical protein
VAGAGALAATPFLLANTANAFAWGRTLKQGLSGSDVLELQIRVAGWAASSASQTRVSLDGEFGPGTARRSSASSRRTGSPSTPSSDRTPRRSSTRWSPRTARRPHFNFSEFTDRSSGTFSGGKLSSHRHQGELPAHHVQAGGAAGEAGQPPDHRQLRLPQHRAQRRGGRASDSMHLYGTPPT